MSKLWLWRNFVDGRPEFWAFHNPYPVHPSGDPMVIGEPVGYAIVKESRIGRMDVPESEVIEAIKRAGKLPTVRHQSCHQYCQRAKDTLLAVAAENEYTRLRRLIEKRKSGLLSSSDQGAAVAASELSDLLAAFDSGQL